mmetsp:Transcript_36865/g.77827  ORF Transcript_36865/g.77827 Transcript_36865/m.77827 type:complete len:979 (-) Transcript_36865:324-3260(-)|eukprot:CAMPEP_0183715266 /NCGR_PEP_ID=MMETSP0737-20130205/9566_1 /TAXON_ID=385413 /ORGANISM="Thalassiosira miniscula, Strain CCMP1093" /LENGTH=978 /DNA_ID=CAMNT_0025944355 /DNA_START=469 /DNA_END=3405 /DNA_ORIENTATION=-
MKAIATSSKLITFFIYLALQAAIVTSECNVSWDVSCNRLSLTSEITLSLVDDVSGADVSDEYEASIVFHWGDGAKFTELGSDQSYETGLDHVLTEDHSYENDGEYYVGYQVTFGAGAGNGCEDETFGGYKILWFDNVAKTCGFKSVPEDWEPPTISPTDAPTTSPSKRPTKQPSQRPTPNPTPPPTKNPTKQPTTPEPSMETMVTEFLPICDYDGSCSLSEYADFCENDCANIILTTNRGEDGNKYTQAKGTMFSLRSKDRHISIKSIDIYSSEVGLDRVEVFTKSNSYIGFETQDKKWFKVYDNYNTLMVSNSKRLNLNNRKGVTVRAGDEQSFFVYTESRVQCYESTMMGQAFASDDVLEVYQGVEVEEKWSSGGSGARPLAFRGAFMYDIIRDPPSAAPTIAVEDEEVGSERTYKPTVAVTRPATPPPVPPSVPTTPVPVPVDNGAPANTNKTETSMDLPVILPMPDVSTPLAPTAPTPNETIPMEKDEVSSIMILYHSDILDEDSEMIWVKVTSKILHSLAIDISGLDSSLVEVTVELNGQDHLEQVRMLSGIHGDTQTMEDIGLQHRDFRRHLTESPLPLQVTFTTTVQFPSENGALNAKQLVSSAFQSRPKQRDYINALKEEKTDDGVAYFESLDNVSIEVDGVKVTDGESKPKGTSEEATDGAGDGEILDETPRGTIDGAKKSDEEINDSNKGNKNTMYVIIAAIAAGACIMLFGMAIGVYYITRKKNRATADTAKSTTASRKADPRIFTSNDKMGTYDIDKTGLEIETKSETYMLNHQPTPTSYIGEEAEVDDVSTLGDPYMGDAVNAVMDTDNTVGESMVSSQQEHYVYGLRPTLGGASTIGGNSTINGGSKLTGMIFGDDPTLEDIYRSPQCSTNEGEFERLTVVAPSGKLGIVLDNPNGDLPIIWAIKETSALHGQVRVGDLLLSVDGVDCRGMSTHRVSSFLSSRSTNPIRTLVLARGLGFDDGGV